MNEFNENFTPADLENHEKLADIESTGHSYGAIIKESKDIPEYVEKPLIEACKILYDKNIQTVGSNANIKSGYKEAVVSISWDSLSEENRKIAFKLGAKPNPSNWGHHGKIISFTMPINESTPINDISQYFSKIANEFVIQNPDWIPILSPSEVKKIYGFEPDEEVAPEDFPDYYYDPESKKFYQSKEHYQKVKSYEGILNHKKD